MSKIGIGIGVKIDDIKKVKSSLETQIKNIKGLKADIKDFNIDEATMSKKLQGKINTLSKNIKLKIGGIELDEANINKLQSQLNKLSKNTTVKISKIEISDKATGTLQAQLNKAMKGLVVKVGNVEFDVTKIDTVVNKTKQATQEATKYKKVMGSSLNIGDGSKSFSDLQKRANEIRKTVDSLQKVDITTGKNGNMEQAMLTYTDGMGRLVKETMGWKTVMNSANGSAEKIFTTLGTKVTENTKKIERFKSEVVSLKATLNGQLGTLGDLGFNKGMLGNLQTQINSINTRTPQSQVDALKQKMQNLYNNGTNSAGKLQNAINSLTNRINNIKNTKMNIINSNNLGELKTAQSELRKLKDLQLQIKAGKIIDGKLISSEIATARNSVGQLRTAINSCSTSGLTLGRVMKNVMSYTMGGSAIYMGINEIRKGLTNIKDVDTAMRDLKRVSDDVNSTTLDGFTNQANTMAKQLGNTTESVIKATTTFKQLGYSWSEAKDFMASQSITLANVGDMTAEDSASAIVATLKGFRLEAKDTTMVIDSLNEAGNKFAIKTGELAEGLRISSASLAIANNDLYESEALITAGTEVLRDSNTVGNGLKTISMRLNQVKTVGGETFYKLKSDLKSIGNTELTDVNGNLRSTYDIIKDLSKEWDSGRMTDMNKSKLLDGVAGKQQAKVMAAILQNGKSLEKMYETLSNSSGSAQAEQERYMDSIEGKLNAFKETVKSLWLNTIDSSSVKGILDGATTITGALDSVMKKMGSMPTIIATVVVALTIFNAKFRASTTMFANMIPGINMVNTKLGGYVTKLSTTTKALQILIARQKEHILTAQSQGASTAGMGVKLAQLNGKLALTTIAMTTARIATVALQSAMSMGLSVVISLAISKIMELAQAQENLKKANDEATASYTTEKEGIASATALLAKKKELESQISQTNEGSKESKKLKTQLIDVERQLAQILPNSVSGYDAQGKAISANNALIERQIKLKKQASIDANVNQIKENDTFRINDPNSLENSLTTLENLKKKKEELEKDIDTMNTTNTTSVKKEGWVLRLGMAKDQLENVDKEMTSLSSKTASTTLLITQLMDAGLDFKQISASTGMTENTVKAYAETMSDAGENTSGIADKIKTAVSAVNELGTRNEIATSTVNNLKKAFPDMGIEVDNASQKVGSLKKELEANKGLWGSATGELADKGSLSESTITKLANAFPTLGINAENAESTLNGLGDALDDLTSDSDSNADAIAKATKAYGDETSAIAKAQGYLDRLNKAQAVTPALAQQLTKAYGNGVAGKINTAAEAQAFLNSKIKEQQTLQAQNYEIMMGDDEAFYQAKVANSEEFQSAYNNLLNAFTSDGEEAYTLDYGNYTTLNQLKEQTQSDLGVAVENWLRGFVGSSADGYADDFSNFKSMAEAKADVLNKLNEQIKKINANMASAQASADKYNAKLTSGDFSNSNDVTQYEASARASANEMMVDRYKDKLGELNGAVQEVDTTFDEFGASMKGYTGGGIGTSDFSGTGGDSDAKKASDDAKKLGEEIAKMNSSVKPDVYFELNQAVKYLDNELEKNQSIMESLTEGTVEYQKAQENQIVLEQKKQVALENLNKEQKKQAEVLKAYLTQYGFTMDEMGNLTNSQSQIQYWQDITNAMGGNTEEAKAKKQEWIDWIKELEDKTKDYADLVNDKIPDVTAQFKALGDQIRKTAKEQLGNLRDDIVGALSQEYEAKQDAKMDKIDEAYDKKKKRLEKEYEDDKENLQAEKESEVQDYQDEIDALQERLDDLNDDSDEKKEKLAKLKSELAKWNLDDSVFADNKRKELTKEIADIEKDITKDSLQDQIDALTKKKEANSDSYDEELKNLEKSNKEELDEAEDYYKEQKKKYEDYYEKKLKDENLYAEADKLIKGNQQEEILELLGTYSEKYKDVGTLLGENFKEGFKAQIEEAMKDLKMLTDKVSGPDNSSEDSVDSKTSSSDTSGLTGELNIKALRSGDAFGGTTTSGHKYQVLPNGDVASYGEGGWVTQEELKDIQSHIAKYDTGGRVPDNINSNGKLAILDSGEKILNKEDTIMTDRIFQYVNQTMGLLNNMNSMLNHYNPGDSLSNRIPSVNSNISNLSTSQNTNSNVSLQNTINVTNNTKDDSYFNAKSLDRMWKNQTSRFS